MKKIQAAIESDRFYEFYSANRKALIQTDQDHPPEIPKKGKKKTKTFQIGDFEVVQSNLGHWSIRQISSGEIMHSVSEPNTEARRIYVDQSILLKQSKHPLVIWDVGLGAAHNAMALIHALHTENLTRESIQIESFEKDLDPLRLAFLHIRHFPHLRHPGPHRLFAEKKYETDRLSWKLYEGDFLELYRNAKTPDIIFYDPFSSKVDTLLWSYFTFQEIYQYLNQTAPNQVTELFTYSNSTAIRSALLAAGFYVAEGAASGPKESTTIAIKSGPLSFQELKSKFPYSYLESKWLDRRSRSTARWTPDVTLHQQQELETRIRSHPQFDFMN
jgi:queuine tRNA-ribosyltransferase